MSLLYEGTTEEMSVQLASAYLSSLLWSRLTGANVVIQVYNRTAILNRQHLTLLAEMASEKITILYGNAEHHHHDVCDLVLESTISRMLLASKLSPR